MQPRHIQMSNPVKANGLTAQLLREWSDPARYAHVDWLGDLPAGWPERARAEVGARRVLSEQIRTRVPLQALCEPEQACARAPWALGDKADVVATTGHIGWSVLQPWVARTVTRAQVMCIVECVGERRYESALRKRPAFLTGDTLMPRALLHETPAQLISLMQGIGWLTLMRILCGPLQVLRERVRLVAGPRLDGQAPPYEPCIDADVLLDELAGGFLQQAS